MIEREKIKKVLLEKRINSAQLIMVVATILWSVGLGKTFAEIIIYSIVQIVLVILGVSLINMRKLAENITEIYYNPKLTPQQKEKEYMKIALVVLDKIGDIYEQNKGVLETDG